MTAQSEETRIALMAQRLENIDNNVKDIKSTLRENYVSKSDLANMGGEVAVLKDQVLRLNQIMFGVIMAILIALVGAGFSIIKTL